MSETRTIEFQSVGGGQYGWAPRETGYGPQCLLIRSARAWGEVANDFSMNPGETPENSDALIRGVDYSRRSLLVVTMGEMGSTGFSIRLERIEAGPPIKVVMTSTWPRPDDMVGAAMTHPFHISVVSATELPKDAVFELDGKVVQVERHVRD